VERTSRFVLLTQMNGCTATHALDGFTRRFNGVIPELRKSFTYDRGSEMARHLELSAATGMPVFFCEPYSPWQRGSNENMNGLVRQFLPKGGWICPPSPLKNWPISKPCSMTGRARFWAFVRPARSIPNSSKNIGLSASLVQINALHFKLDTTL
jgi:hypothetical protein